MVDFGLGREWVESVWAAIWGDKKRYQVLDMDGQDKKGGTGRRKKFASCSPCVHVFRYFMYMRSNNCGGQRAIC